MSTTSQRHSVSSTYGRQPRTSGAVDTQEESNHSDTLADDCQVVKVSKNKYGQKSKKSSRDTKGEGSDATDADEDKSDEEGSDEQFEVSEIKNHRTKKGQIEYYVGWKGYDSAADTWEPESNLQGAPELLKRYKSKHISRSKSSRHSTASNKSSSKRTRDQSDDDEDSVSEQSSKPRRKKDKKEPATTGSTLVSSTTRKNSLDGSKKATQHKPMINESRESSAVDKDVEDVDSKSDEEWLDRHRNEKSWEHLVQSVKNIEEDFEDDKTSNNDREPSDRIYVLLLWKSGKETLVSNAVARAKVPQKLLDFYEDHLEFRPREVKNGKINKKKQ